MMRSLPAFPYVPCGCSEKQAGLYHSLSVWKAGIQIATRDDVRASACGQPLRATAVNPACRREPTSEGYPDRYVKIPVNSQPRMNSSGNSAFPTVRNVVDSADAEGYSGDRSWIARDPPTR